MSSKIPDFTQLGYEDVEVASATGEPAHESGANWTTPEGIDIAPWYDETAVADRLRIRWCSSLRPRHGSPMPGSGGGRRGSGWR